MRHHVISDGQRLNDDTSFIHWLQQATIGLINTLVRARLFVACTSSKTCTWTWYLERKIVFTPLILAARLLLARIRYSHCHLYCRTHDMPNQSLSWADMPHQRCYTNDFIYVVVVVVDLVITIVGGKMEMKNIWWKLQCRAGLTNVGPCSVKLGHFHSESINTGHSCRPVTTCNRLT